MILKIISQKAYRTLKEIVNLNELVALIIKIQL